MACFIIPGGEAVITTVAERIVRAQEKDENLNVPKVSFSTKLGWLNKLLWGGSALLAFEHVWHGEVTPWFPFLTAMNSAEDAAEMFHEMSTVGVSMALLCTGVWGVMLAVSHAMEKKAAKEAEAKEA